jgi:hypothetical protein
MTDDLPGYPYFLKDIRWIGCLENGEARQRVLGGGLAQKMEANLD